MAPFDLAAGLADIDPDAPAGPNLELDGAFGELERTAQGTPERQAGNTIVPAEDPSWKEVAAQASALLDKTHDLRVLTHLAVARLHLSGLADFAAVLGMMRQLLETRWEFVHPQLDPEDDNDPTLRANALLPLTNHNRVLRLLRTMPLATSQRAGTVSWRIISIALGAIESQDAQEKKTENEIRTAFAETSVARIEALREHIAGAGAAIGGITAAFDTHSGYGNAPDLTPLSKLLAEVDRYIGLYYVPGTAAPELGAGTADNGDADAAAASGAASGGGAPAARGAVTATALTSVSTRAEAVHLLDVVCRYYQQYEPSSPLPLMIDRARRLADKSFLEILADLAPDGVGQAQAVVQSRES